MLEKIFVALLFLLSVPIADARNFKRMDARTASLYASLVLASLYLSYIFVTGASLPNLSDLYRALFGGAAESLVRYLDK
ncbi:hypothetical protein [Cohnella boryungensis]|uniref:Holin n=1 Tax=Cohnella boryungensis TaxID=768479 RepID=A0ABV8S4Z9_9BACL